MTNAEIIRAAQAEIIKNGEAENYPIEQHLRDMDLLADLSLLHKIYNK